MDNFPGQFGISAILMTAVLTGVGFFVKYLVNQLRDLGIELRQELKDLRSELKTITSDVADMKPKVNALWEHFLKINNKP